MSIPTDARQFFVQTFREFLAVCAERRALLFLFIFSFIKTFFIFWPMVSGALFKFGIEDAETRRLYLIAIVIMDVVSMLSLYAIGLKQSFSNRTFVIGCFISGTGIVMFALVNTVAMLIATLAVCTSA